MEHCGKYRIFRRDNKPLLHGMANHDNNAR
jgi:hypothetical protein